MSSLVCLGRHTVTGLIAARGQQFQDWSADYRLFSEGRFDPDVLFEATRRGIICELSEGMPFVAAMDDTIVHKTGTKIPGVGYRRDPLGPPFRVNLIKGQRFIQISAAMPAGAMPTHARMIPIDLIHAPTAKKPGKNASEEDNQRYKKAQKRCNLSLQGVERIIKLRKDLDGDLTGVDRPLLINVDGSYTNGTVLKKLPDRTILTGRIRKDAKFHYPVSESDRKVNGRKRIYGDKAPTPEELRKDDSIPWKTVKVWAAGKKHDFDIKTLAPLKWRTAGGAHNLRLIVIRPLAYRPRKGAKLLYRKPAYLICTDTELPLEVILQAYVWRWDIEVNFRDEKQLIGVGEAQVRNQASVEKAPQFLVASYAMLLLAATRAHGVDGMPDALPSPKWRKNKKPYRASTQTLINMLRAEMWSKSMITDNFSGFVSSQTPNKKTEKLEPDLASTVLYAVA